MTKQWQILYLYQKIKHKLIACIASVVDEYELVQHALMHVFYKKEFLA